MKLYDLANMTTSTTGTGTATLVAAVSGFLTFAQSGVQNGEIVRYGIKDGANREVGWGVYSSSGPTLTRNVLKSTNDDAAIDLSGSAEVFITAAAEDFLGLYRQVMSAPPTQASTGLSSWANQSISSVADTPVGMTITSPSGASGNMSCLYKSASGIASVTALMSVTTPPGNGSVNPGALIGFYDGTKLEVLTLFSVGNNSTYTAVYRWNNTGSYNSSPFAMVGHSSMSSPLWTRVEISEGNLRYLVSSDGYNFTLLRSNSVTEFLSEATYVVFGAMKPPVDSCHASILSWAEA